MKIVTLKGGRVFLIKDGTWKCVGDKINEIRANAQCFKLGSPLKKCSKGELFINDGSSIDGDHGCIEGRGIEGNHFERKKSCWRDGFSNTI